MSVKGVRLKGVFAKNEMGYMLTAKNYRWFSLLILPLSVGSIRRKLLKTTHTEEHGVHTILEVAILVKKKNNLIPNKSFRFYNL